MGRRTILGVDALAKEFETAGWTPHVIYKLVHRPDHPLPYKKNGKRLEFDLDRVYQWWGELPGVDRTAV